ncbi:MAG: DNA translocase FtsK 4TM domain-containing protein, partial [SAR202 cluster bacterium]|nr:DNA translocase FtsK 4TM domain-containing protein [SAR202 cluster bacterium]
MNSHILIKINDFVKNRLVEFSGILLAIIGFFFLISIASYSPADPNFIYAPGDVEIKNIGGFYGSVISDFLLQSIGLISFLMVINLLNWGLTLIVRKKIGNFIAKIFFKISYTIFGSTFINIFYNDSFWLI